MIVKSSFHVLNYSTGAPHRIEVDSTSILHRYVEDQISTNFHVISTYFFDVISPIEKSTLFPCSFFDVISLVKKSTLFPCSLFDVEKFTLFPRTFFDVISMVRKSAWFAPHFFWCTFSGRNIHVGSTYFVRRNFDGQKFDIVFRNLYANENIRGGFPVFVTFNSWLL